MGFRSVGAVGLTVTHETQAMEAGLAEGVGRDGCLYSGELEKAQKMC